MYLIGYILKPQGVKGEVKVQSVSPYLERYKRLDKVFVQSSGQIKPFTIQNVRVTDRFVFLGFLEVKSRDQAALLRGAELLVEAEDVLKPAPDEYFIHDLIGCSVITEDGHLIGILTEVVQITANDVYVVRNDDGEEILLPAVKDVIKQVDVMKKEIVVHLLDGLLE
ncbi:MAG: 16S rRNA processing protein RimM [Calditrichales bacterium]|nr:MAG: 16S rRNA processing protein RimM [Calditrichales bacterium]